MNSLHDLIQFYNLGCAGFGFYSVLISCLDIHFEGFNIR